MAISKPTAQSVIDLTGTDLPVPVVDQIINDAALLAEGCLAPLSAEKQEAALRWLSAHMVASTSDVGSQSLTSQKLGDATESYGKATLGTGISGTTYGQQAIAIAPCLGRLGRSRASIEVV